MSVGNEIIFLPNIDTYYGRNVFGETLFKTLIRQNFVDVKRSV